MWRTKVAGGAVTGLLLVLRMTWEPAMWELFMFREPAAVFRRWLIGFVYA